MAPEFETLLVSGIKTEEEESSQYILDQYGIEPHYVKEMKREINFKSDRNAYREIKEIIQHFKPDIVHTHAAKAGTLGRLAAAHCNVPVIVHTFHGHVFHSYFSPVKTKVFIEIEKYLARKSAAIVTISDLQKHEICDVYKICKPSKAHVIPLGFDLSRFRENMDFKRKDFRMKYGLEEDTVAIGIIGRFAAIKNHVFFLRAMKYIMEKTTKKVVAFLIGDGEQRQSIIESCNGLGIDYTFDTSIKKATVVFTSWIKEIDWALAGLDIITMTSFNEGTPVSLIEAQAASRPIVSTRVGGIENVVIKNKTALLSDSGDLKSFEQNLLKMIEGEELRRQFSEVGWQFVENKFHYTRLVNDMKELYGQLL
jgi:glycosyltransferase involved in cell wall biosynthesis